jgi:hypothetical protein
MRHSIQTGIWLLGIAILAISGWWWPGIMFVIAASALAGGSFQGFLWTAGIGVIAWLNWWWPGMLILAGLGMFFSRGQKPAIDAGTAPEWANAPEPARYPPFPETPAEEPAKAEQPPAARCPACGGPLNETTVRWQNDHRAECQWCNTVLRPQ